MIVVVNSYIIIERNIKFSNKTAMFLVVHFVKLLTAVSVRQRMQIFPCAYHTHFLILIKTCYLWSHTVRITTLMIDRDNLAFHSLTFNMQNI